MENEIMVDIVNMMLPISIVVVLPVLVVWLVCRTVANRDNKKAEIVIKAIENNNAIEADKIANALAKRAKSPREMLNLRLLRGCIFGCVGVALLIFTIVIGCLGCSYDELNTTLVFAMLSLAIGVAYIVVYFVTRKSVTDKVE